MRRSIRILFGLMFLLSACTSKKVDPTPTVTPTVIPPTSTPNPAPTATPFKQVFPTTNPDMLLFSVNVEIVRVANDDGSDLAAITPDQVLKLVDTANEILAQYSIRLEFDPQTDVDILQSTAIADMLGKGDTDWQASMEAADEIATKYHDKITVFVRKNQVFEPDPSQKFFWWDYNFVVISMDDTSYCDQEDYTSLIHAIGHYLGLGNTYKQEFSSLEDANKAYIDSGYNLNFFDGDGFTDTPADIFINQTDYVCGLNGTFDMNGITVPITRGNVMAGYHPRDSFTDEQITRARYILALRQRLGMIMTSNRNINGPVEMETATLNQQNWLTPEVVDLTEYSNRNFSGGKGLKVVAGYGSTLGIDFTVDKDGVYDMTFYAVQTPDSGILEVYVDDTMVNDMVNLYGPYTYASGAISLGTYYLTQGTHTMQFKVIKKDPLSIGYNFTLDAYTVKYKPQ